MARDENGFRTLGHHIKTLKRRRDFLMSKTRESSPRDFEKAEVAAINCALDLMKEREEQTEEDRADG
jgi:vacuolar-type H+-ATPase subunit H